MAQHWVKKRIREKGMGVGRGVVGLGKVPPSFFNFPFLEPPLKLTSVAIWCDDQKFSMGVFNLYGYFA